METGEESLAAVAGMFSSKAKGNVCTFRPPGIKRNHNALTKTEGILSDCRDTVFLSLFEYLR